MLGIGGVQAPLSDKRRRVTPESRRTRLLDSQLLAAGRSCGSVGSRMCEKSGRKRNRALAPNRWSAPPLRPEADPMMPIKSDKKSRVLRDSRRTGLRYSQPLVPEMNQASKSCLSPKKKRTKADIFAPAEEVKMGSMGRKPGYPRLSRSSYRKLRVLEPTDAAGHNADRTARGIQPAGVLPLAAVRWRLFAATSA